MDEKNHFINCLPDYEIREYGFNMSMYYDKTPVFGNGFHIFKNGQKVKLDWDKSLFYDHNWSLEDELIDRIERQIK